MHEQVFLILSSRVTPSLPFALLVSLRCPLAPPRALVPFCLLLSLRPQSRALTAQSARAVVQGTGGGMRHCTVGGSAGRCSAVPCDGMRDAMRCDAPCAELT